jgi:hypothetical protein
MRLLIAGWLASSKQGRPVAAMKSKTDMKFCGDDDQMKDLPQNVNVRKIPDNNQPSHNTGVEIVS